MNTELTLLYRDACNYKAVTSVVFAGDVDPALVERLIASLDERQFLVPEQVGLIHPGRVNSVFAPRFPDEEDDHGAVEIDADSITPTLRRPTDRRTFAEFVAACEAAAGEGWNPDLAIEAAGGWTDPDVAARLRGGTT